MGKKPTGRGTKKSTVRDQIGKSNPGGQFRVLFQILKLNTETVAFSNPDMKWAPVIQVYLHLNKLY